MTEFFAYEKLTWPEVRALPRDLPLVLPLGNGYSPVKVAEALGNPARAAWLPAIPFGWRGSALSVREDCLAALTGNLLASLRDEGFSRPYLLTPPGIDLGLANGHFALKPEDTSPVPLPDLADRHKVVLIPVGHTEQHALHLPLAVDSLLIERIATAAAAAASESALCLPLMPYGVSTHRAAFAGTLNCGGRAFEDFWLAALDTLAARGCNKVFFLNGHGGNHSFLVNVVKYGGERHPGMFTATTWLYLSGPAGVAALAERRRSALGGMGHACELETALMLHLYPHLVHMERVSDDTGFVSTQSFYNDWVEGGALIANPPWEDDSRNGALGAGSLANADNGRFWFEAAVAEKVEQVHEIEQQYRLRQQKRRERTVNSTERGERL